jgi:hypothetical protein
MIDIYILTQATFTNPFLEFNSVLSIICTSSSTLVGSGHFLSSSAHSSISINLYIDILPLPQPCGIISCHRLLSPNCCISPVAIQNRNMLNITQTTSIPLSPFVPIHIRPCYMPAYLFPYAGISSSHDPNSLPAYYLVYRTTTVLLF